MAGDWVWLVDHSHQLGPARLLAILGLRAGELPPPGETLTHPQMQLLELKVQTRFDRQAVESVYRDLARRLGRPRAILSDQAAELQEAVGVLNPSTSPKARCWC